MKKITHLISLFALGGTVAALSFGCGSDPAGSGSGSGSGSGGAGTGGTTSVGPGPGSGGSGGGGGGGMVDKSTSCADAVELTVSAQASNVYEGTGIINPANDSDYFKFTVADGDWVILRTEANPDDDINKIDTVITLFNEDGTVQYAEADDQTPRRSTDSELFHHFLAAGTYCVQVQDFSSWKAGETPEGSPDFAYKLTAATLSDQVAAVTLDSGDNNDKASPQAMTQTPDDMSGQLFSWILGTYDAEGDVDSYQFTAPPTAVGVSLDFMPRGSDANNTDAYGNSDSPGLINVYESDGATPPVLTRVATLDYTNGSSGFSSVPVTAGNDYVIEVAKAPGALGANPFYVLTMATASALNPQEMDDMANNNAANAEGTMAQDNADGSKSYFLGGAMPASDGADWWKVAGVKKGDNIAVVCSSQRAGSGVGDFTVEYYGVTPGATAIVAQTETATTDIYWSAAPSASHAGLVAAEAGDQYFKLSSTMDIADVASMHYLCGIHVSTP